VGPKFDPYLNFQADGSLDVCGPTNFSPHDVMFTLAHVRLKDRANTQVEQTFNPPPALFGNGDLMWEGDIPRGKAKTLVPGPARATGKGRVLHRNGKEEDVEWANDVVLAKPSTFLAGKSD
jgi:hypothetical protein